MPTRTKSLLSQEILNKHFAYDPVSGLLTWKIRSARCITVGDVAGCKERSCLRVRLFKTNWAAHRIIWKILYNTEPEQIDHINGNPHDNRLCNIRAATANENRWNSRVMRTRKFRSPLKGAYMTGDGKWASVIRKFGVTYYLGRFPTDKKAHEAYVLKAQELHQEFANAGFR